MATEVEILSSKQVSTVVKIRHWQLGNSCLSCFKWASSFYLVCFIIMKQELQIFQMMRMAKFVSLAVLLTILSHLTEIFCLS